MARHSSELFKAPMDSCRQKSESEHRIALFIPNQLHHTGMAVGIVKGIAHDLFIGAGMIDHQIFPVFIHSKAIVAGTVSLMLRTCHKNGGRRLHPRFPL